MGHISRKGAQRIARQTKSAERRPLSPGVPQRARPNTFMVGGGGAAEVRLAVAVGAINVPTWDGTTLTPGIGTAYVLADNAPNWLLSGSSITVHHTIPGGDAIESGAVMVVAQANARWVILSAACDPEISFAAIAAPSYYDGELGFGGGGGGLDSEQESIDGGWNGMLTAQGINTGTGTGTDTGTGFGGFF